MPTRSERVDWLLGSGLQIGLAGLGLTSAYQLMVSAGLSVPALDSGIQVAGLAKDFALAFLSSWIFNLVVVVAPSMSRRSRIRRWAMKRHERLKSDLITVYFGVIGHSWEPDELSRLLNPQAFVDFFTQRYSSDQNRWHAVHNGLYEWGLAEIRGLLSQFCSECEQAVSMIGEIGSAGDRVLSYVRFLSRQAIVAKPEYDDIKALLNSLFEFHAHWSILDGQIKVDQLRKLLASM